MLNNNAWSECHLLGYGTACYGNDYSPDFNDRSVKPVSQYLSRLRHLTSWFSLATFLMSAVYLHERREWRNTELRRSPPLNFSVLVLLRHGLSTELCGCCPTPPMFVIYSDHLNILHWPHSSVGSILLLVLESPFLCSDGTFPVLFFSTIFSNYLNICSLEWQINFEIHIKKN
jgi:hypothetical protein